jgi:hypothetical protein
MLVGRDASVSHVNHLLRHDQDQCLGLCVAWRFVDQEHQIDVFIEVDMEIA